MFKLAKQLVSVNEDKNISLANLLINLSFKNWLVDNKVNGLVIDTVHEEEVIEQKPKVNGNKNRRNSNISVEVIDTQENEQDEDDDDEEDQNEISLISAIKDFIKFCSEYSLKTIDVSDFHILTDSLCHIIGIQDAQIRHNCVEIFTHFADLIDEEAIELIDEFLFEDIEQKIKEFEQNPFTIVDPENLDIGDDIDLEEMDEETLKQELNPEIEN